MWVCPPMADFAPLQTALAPTLTLADVLRDSGAVAGATPDALADAQRWRRWTAIVERSDLVLTDDESARSGLDVLGPSVHVVPDGIDPAAPDGRPAPDALRGLTGPLVGYVGDMSPALDLALLDELARRRPDWQLVLAGDGAPGVVAARLAGHANVHVLRMTGRAQLARCAAALDVALLPLSAREASPGWTPASMLLYAAAGVPVVSTIEPGLVDLRAGVRIASAAAGVAAAVDDQLARRRAGEWTAAPQSVLERHGWPERIRQVKRLIDAALARRAGGGDGAVGGSPSARGPTAQRSAPVGVRG